MAKGLVQWLTFRNPDFQIFNTSHDYGTSATVRDSNTLHQSQLMDEISANERDFERYICKLSLAYSFICFNLTGAANLLFGCFVVVNSKEHDQNGLQIMRTHAVE